MELTDIMPVEDWKAIAENINRKFGMNGTVYHKDNSVLAKSAGWANKVCPAIKAGDSVVVCSSAQQRLSKIAAENKNFATGECDAGCMKFLVPVFFKGEFVGMVGGCGRVPEGSEVDAFYIGKLLSKTKEETERLLASVNHITDEGLNAAISYTRKQLQEYLSK
jgi:ligand-binding sensor protein